jgi:hypothetical protein
MRNRTALDQLQIKRMADLAFFRDMTKRQRRCIEHLAQQLELPDEQPEAGGVGS